MTSVLWQRVAAIYAPLVASLLAWVIHRAHSSRQNRLFPACLLSLLWAAASLLVLQRLNQYYLWWSFTPSDALFRGIPVELYFGWILLWGILPQLAFPQLRLVFVAVIMVALDMALMPACHNLVHLGPRWLIGEAAALIFVLGPAIAIARWTRDDTHLPARAVLQVALAGLLFLYAIPEIAFALRPGPGWSPLFTLPGSRLQLGVQFLAALALPGVAAVMEFAERGGGTPIPYDPPKRLVTSGIYRYCANPMQVSCCLVMMLWSAMLANPWLLLPAAISVLYSAGIAEWDEKQDLEKRFGVPFAAYRAAVHSWWPRLRPFHAGLDARLYVDSRCEPCSQLQRWLESREPIGLAILDAGDLPRGTIRRMRYDPADGSESVDGIRALGRALEHLNFGWALAGAALRLPLVWQFVQVLMDASGFGPRLPASHCEVRGRRPIESIATPKNLEK